MKQLYFFLILLYSTLYAQESHFPTTTKVITIAKPVFIESHQQPTIPLSCWVPISDPIYTLTVKPFSRLSEDSKWVALTFNYFDVQAIKQMNVSFIQVTYEEVNIANELLPRTVVSVEPCIITPTIGSLEQEHEEQKKLMLEFESYGLVIGEFKLESELNIRGRLTVDPLWKFRYSSGFCSIKGLYKYGLGHFEQVEYASAPNLVNFVFGYQPKNDTYKRRFYVVKRLMFSGPYAVIVLKKRNRVKDTNLAFQLPYSQNVLH